MTVSLGAKWWRVRPRARQGPAGKKAKECCRVQAGPALDTEQHRSGSGGQTKAKGAESLAPSLASVSAAMCVLRGGVSPLWQQ